MAIKPRWHADIPRIRHEIKAMGSMADLDRKTIEALFGVKARQANYIMRSIPGRIQGGAAIVEREALLAKLDELSGPHGVARAEPARKAQLVETIDTLRFSARPRKITMPAPTPRRSSRQLPPGVAVSAPGTMVILYSTPEEFLGSIFAMAEAAGEDFASFAEMLEFRPPRTESRKSGENVATASSASDTGSQTQTEVPEIRRDNGAGSITGASLPEDERQAFAGL